MFLLMYIHIYNYINTDVENYDPVKEPGQAEEDEGMSLHLFLKGINETPPTFHSYKQICRICYIYIYPIYVCVCVCVMYLALTITVYKCLCIS